MSAPEVGDAAETLQEYLHTECAMSPAEVHAAWPAIEAYAQTVALRAVLECVSASAAPPPDEVRRKADAETARILAPLGK